MSLGTIDRARSALRFAETRLQAVAHNTANMVTEGFKEQEVLDRFQNALRRKEAEQSFKRKRMENSALEKGLRAYKQRTGLRAGLWNTL